MLNSMGRLTANAYKPLRYRRQTQILINFSDGKLYVNGAKTDRQCLAVIQVKKLQTEMLKLSQNLALQKQEI